MNSPNLFNAIKELIAELRAQAPSGIMNQRILVLTDLVDRKIRELDSQ